MPQPFHQGEVPNLTGRPRWQWTAIAALGVAALFLLQLLVISTVMAPGQDLAEPLVGIDPLWEEREDKVKILEEKVLRLQEQLSLQQGKEAMIENTIKEKFDKFENSQLALGKKVDNAFGANVADENVRLIAEELKGLEIRMKTVETMKHHSEEGEGKVEKLAPSLVREVKELAMSVASKTTDSVIETKVKDFGKGQELKVADIQKEVENLVQETVKEHLAGQIEDTMSIERRERQAMMDRIHKVEELAAKRTESPPKVVSTVTPLQDWASEEAGGIVVESSAGYPLASLPTLTVLGLPIWWSSNLPSLALRPGNLPGQCWAMEGSQGYLVLQLGAPIRVSGVSFVLGKNVKDASSAPRTVSISAEPFVEPLMNVTLPQRASEEVTFRLEEESLSSISRVKIEVLENHGNPSYTCLYRVMVHGTPAEEEVGDLGGPEMLVPAEDKNLGTENMLQEFY